MPINSKRARVALCCRISYAMKMPRHALRDDPDTFAKRAQGTITIYCECGYWGSGDLEVNAEGRFAGFRVVRMRDQG